MNNKNTKKTVYVVGAGYSYLNWVLDAGFKQVSNPDSANVIFFTGGEDCNPFYYGEPVGLHTGFNNNRDVEERKVYFKYVGKKSFIGVCRGAQQLGYLNGGKLIQHSAHPSYHDIKTSDGKIVEVTSSHHQQVLVDERITGLKEGKDYNLLGWAENLSPMHLDGNNVDYNLGEDYREVEAIWFPKTRSLLNQFHPEWGSMDSDMVKYSQSLLNLF